MSPHPTRILLAGVLLLAACKRPGKEGADLAKPATEEQAAVPTVRFQKIVERKLPPTITASGTLAADETSEVASPGPGVVVKVEVDVGSRVKRGDVLVQIDPRDPSLKVQQANAATAQAFAKLRD
ncbi:MAG: efflux RND transporter periplasmic adaptor subunit [Minicystis sp.]